MVRTKTEWRTITVSKNIYDRIEEDRKHFEEKIGGGQWSANDTLREWRKLLNIEHIETEPEKIKLHFKTKKDKKVNFTATKINAKIVRKDKNGNNL